MAKFSQFTKLATLLCILVAPIKALDYIDTRNLVWTLSNANGSISVPGSVPGGVYTDLMNEGILDQGDFYYRYNDLNYRWVSYDDWTYTTTIKATPELLANERVVLEFDGLDTAAQVFIEGSLVSATDNMFVRYLVNVKDVLDSSKEQELAIVFQSPVTHSRDSYNDYLNTYGYSVAPECQDAAYKGECHANMIRKMQSSFSWDWGPAFPNMGVWKPFYVLGWSDVKITSIQFAAFPSSPLPDKPDLNLRSAWDITIRVHFDSIRNGGIVEGELSFAINTIFYATSNVTVDTNAITDPDGTISLDFTFSIPADKVETWWPNGYGPQPMYELAVRWNSAIAAQTFFVDIGFRTVELDQSFVDSANESLGRHYRVKVNNVEMFLKGSNWIPAHVLPEQVSNGYVEQLLQDAKDTNQNCLRVWGGGIYESRNFYYVADRLGILIWEDLMFACSMYPANDEYLASVEKEVRSQIRRLQHHPSILLWASNNENEAALRGNWYGTRSNFSLYQSDYVKLYVDVVRTTVLEEDISRPFVVSSPSNGIESEEEGFIAQNPYDNKYGDVHFYNYLSNAWDWQLYPPTRFASEYGFQSWPSFISMSGVTDPVDRSIHSPMMEHRQHHPGGQLELDNQLKRHFSYNESTTSYEDYLYLCQLHQAMAIKTETEFYRRMRSVMNPDGSGLTMGALYWQLNDIWQGASWASIEYGGRWKILHYYAGNFFSPIIASPWITTDGRLHVTIVSDLTEDLNGDFLLLLTLYRYTSQDSYGSFKDITCVWNSDAVEVLDVDLDSALNMTTFCDINGASPADNCFLKVKLIDSKDGSQIAPDNFLLLGEPKDAPISRDPVITLDVSPIPPTTNEFNVTMTTDKIIVFLWLETKIDGVFSENGFILTDPEYSVVFKSRSNDTTASDLLASLQVTSLNTNSVAKAGAMGGFTPSWNLYCLALFSFLIVVY